MIKIAVFGAAGQMGRRIASCAGDDPDLEITGALERDDHPALGKDIGELAGLGEIGVPIVSDPRAALKQADVAIDFSFHEAAIENLPIVVDMKNPIVIGTTGFSADEMQKIKDFSKKIPILQAPNMSLGVNLVFKLAGEIAKTLGPDYDIEIIEAHHNRKKDAPSGTAARIAEEIAAALGENLDEVAVYGREKGIVGPRKSGQIGIHAVRAGGIVGDHTILYAGANERIELTHRAHSRDVFVQGALRAVKFIADAKPGLYTMRHVLGL